MTSRPRFVKGKQDASGESALDTHGRRTASILAENVGYGSKMEDLQTSPFSPARDAEHDRGSWSMAMT
ncbi:MAG: hypothetical protein JJ992_27970, partial [Planctomycetes bacterium]|nr:hypothetical protein [Planctomycetota bacterium]